VLTAGEQTLPINMGCLPHACQRLGSPAGLVLEYVKQLLETKHDSPCGHHLSFPRNGMLAKSLYLRTKNIARIDNSDFFT
jgi:hypothetical protein